MTTHPTPDELMTLDDLKQSIEAMPKKPASPTTCAISTAPGDKRHER